VLLLLAVPAVYSLGQTPVSLNSSAAEKGVVVADPATETPDQQRARVKSWLFTITPDQLLDQLIYADSILNQKPVAKFPETVAILTEKGTLILSYKDPLRVLLGGGLVELDITIPQVEKPKFVTWPGQDPWTWIKPSLIGGGIGLASGVIATLILTHH